jgi:hypothetical protein
MSLSFAKEVVAGVRPSPSMLSTSIAASASPTSGGGSGGGIAGRGTGGDGGSVPAAAASGGVTSQRPGMFTAEQVVTAVLAEAAARGCGAAAAASEGVLDLDGRVTAGALARFELRVAEDDGSVDPDFPPVDGR